MNTRLKPRCYFCNVRGIPMKSQEFHVKVNGKLVLERHKVCTDCEKKHLFAYH